MHLYTFYLRMLVLYPRVFNYKLRSTVCSLKLNNQYIQYTCTIHTIFKNYLSLIYNKLFAMEI